jgi:flagellar basal body P-ring protein FlgI
VLEIEEKINEQYNNRRVAVSLDNKNIRLYKPEEESMVRFSYSFLNMEVKDKEQRVIIDVTNKILVGGEDIVLKPVQILVDDLSIKIKKDIVSDADVLDKNIKDGVIVNLELGLVKKQNTEPILGDLVRGLQKMGIDFNKIVEVIKLLKVKGSISNDIDFI